MFELKIAEVNVQPILLDVSIGMAEVCFCFSNELLLYFIGMSDMLWTPQSKTSRLIPLNIMLLWVGENALWSILK